MSERHPISELTKGWPAEKLAAVDSVRPSCVRRWS